jgi:enoyl-CoA hydratase/carnithine racemase
MAHFSSYSDKYSFIKMERRDGVLKATIHADGGAAKWSVRAGGLHDELGDAFYQIGHDADNRVVILTGAGDEFLTELDMSGQEAFSAAYWNRIYTEGKDLLQNLLGIETIMIGAANGPAFIHAELLTLCDLVIASDRAAFADKAHSPGNVCPADGVHVWWPMLLGPNRGRQFLLMGEEISAQEAKSLGFVAEVVPHDRVQDRAWELAAGLAAKPAMMLRYTRVAFTQHIKRRMNDDLGYGLMLEGMAIMNLVGK